MFLRPTLFRRQFASHVLPIASLSHSAHLGLYRYNSTYSHTSEVLYQPKADVQSVSGPHKSLVSRLDVSLRTLTEKQLLDVIKRTVETRSKLPEAVKRDPNNGYSRAAASTYTNVYLELRRRGTHSLMKTFPEVYVYMAKFSIIMGKQNVIDYVVEDILALVSQLGDGTGHGSVERRYRALVNTLHALTSTNSTAPIDAVPSKLHAQVVKLCNALLLVQRPSGKPPELTVDCLNGVLRAVYSSSEWDDQSTLFLHSLLRYIEAAPSDRYSLSLHPTAHKSSAVYHSLSSLSWNLFRLIRLLLDKGMHDLSISFLQTLVQKEIIPPQVVELPDPETDLRIFMVSVFVRTSVHYGWNDRAWQLLLSEDLTKAEHKATYTALANDLLTTYLVYDGAKLQKCSEMISRLLSQNASIKLKSSLVHKFFKIAYDAKAARAGETMYAALQSSSFRDRYVDWLVHSAVLQWLFGHLVYKSENRSLGKLLAQDIVRSTKPINLYDRGGVIATCATGGYLAETRALWERYASGPEGKMITGHPKSMVGIVKLFKRASDVTAKNSDDLDLAAEKTKGGKETRLEETAMSTAQGYPSGHESPDVKITHYDNVVRQDIAVDNSDSGFVLADSSSSSLGTSEKVSDSTKDYTIREADDLEPEATNISRTVADSRHDTPETALTSTDVEHPKRHGVSGPVTKNSSAISGSEADEHLLFAHKVLDAYRSAKEPLHRASHYDLNALARASDVLGLVRQSMHALQTIVERKEVPDTPDLNVVITAMAARDPLRAEDMLIRMLQEGMHMNSLSFSAVIMGWLQLGDTIGASRVYSRAVRFGHAKLPSEAATPLLAACIDACSPSEVPMAGGPDKETQRVLLRQAYRLIKSEACAQTDIPHDVGARCVKAALGLEEAGVAFYFWKRFLKTRAHRDSPEDKEIRQAVAVLAKKSIAKGMLEVVEGDRMMTELGANGEL